jgi:hypothetical protein
MGSVGIPVADPPGSPASRLLQGCVQRVGMGVAWSVPECMPPQSVGTISDQITHWVSGYPRCRPTGFASKPAPTGLCSASGNADTRSVPGCMPTLSVGTISDRITHWVSGHPRCRPTGFASKPAPTGLCSASGNGGGVERPGMSTQSVGTISEQIIHRVSGYPRCKPTAFASKPAPTGLCSASGTGFSREASDLHLICT